MGGGGEDVADERLSALVGGVGFAGEEDLEAADLFGDCREACRVGEDEAGALVGGDAASEAEGEDVGIELLAGGLLDGVEERELAGAVGRGDLRGGDAVDGTEVLVIGAPAGDLVIEQLLEGFREPGGGMDAVGDGMDGGLGEHVLRDLAVLHGDAVDVAREAEREVGHVEAAVVEGAGALDGGSAFVSEDLVHLVEAELVMACGDGGVGGEDALLLDGVEVGVGGGGRERLPSRLS